MLFNSSSPLAMWNIDFYHLPSGRCPFTDFLDKLHPRNDLVYIMNDLERLKTEGNNMIWGQVKFLRDGIYELRTPTRTLQVRTFYFFYNKSNIIVTNGCAKKDKKRQNEEIDKAIKYKNDYLMRNNNEL